MPNFSHSSTNKLQACDDRLIRLFKEVIKEYDFTVICGHRTEAEQNKAFQEGRSKLKWPQSKHNDFPSKAVDIAPYPIDWTDIKRFHDLNKVVERCAVKLGIPIEWGGNWKTLKDFPHYQLKE